MSSIESPVSGAPGRRRKPASAPAPERSGRSRGTRRRKGGRRGGGRSPIVPVLLGVLGLAVVALAAVLVLEFTGGGDSAADSAGPSRYEVYASGEANELLGEREVDSRPLNENEVFERGSTEITSGDLSFTLEARSLTDDCAEAVWGPRALAALEGADCSQAARGGYVSDDYVGVTAIFKLADTEAAQALAEGLAPDENAAEEGDAGGFLVPPSTEAPFDVFRAGGSAATATVNGHYLVVVWVQSRDIDEPAGSLESPLVALSKFDMPIFYRLTEREQYLENTGGADSGAEAEAGPDGAAGTDGTGG